MRCLFMLERSPSCVVMLFRNRVRLALLLFCWCAPLAQAHDLITSESAERYLAQSMREGEIIRSKAPAAARAEAHFSLGRLLDEIRELLNRDLAAHGRLQGLPTEYLVRELNRHGMPMQVDQQLGRYPSNVHHYREYLKLQPDGARAADALFGILQGSFYDSFDADPMQARSQDWTQLQSEIAVGEALERRAPAYSQREEARFILAVLYTRGARAAPNPVTAAEHARRARSAIADFQARYPDSLRTAALPLLLESLTH